MGMKGYFERRKISIIILERTENLEKMENGINCFTETFYRVAINQIKLFFLIVKLFMTGFDLKERERERETAGKQESW